MKYKNGNIVLLQTGKAVSIISVDEENNGYQVVDTDDIDNVFFVKESDIHSYLT